MPGDARGWGVMLASPARSEKPPAVQDWLQGCCAGQEGWKSSRARRRRRAPSIPASPAARAALAPAAPAAAARGQEASASLRGGCWVSGGLQQETGLEELKGTS